MNRLLYVVVVTVVLSGLSMDVLWGEVDVCGLRVEKPSEKLVERLGLGEFYGKCVMVDGFAVISSGKVNDYALLEAGYLIKTVLKNRADILKALVDNKVRFVVMAYDELTTDVPEHSDLRPGKFWISGRAGLVRRRFGGRRAAGRKTCFAIRGIRMCRRIY